MGRLIEAVQVGDREEIRESLENLESLGEWLGLDKFDRARVKRHLRKLAVGGQEQFVED